MENVIYTQASLKDLSVQVRSENPNNKHMPYVLDIKKGDTGAITLTLEDAKFLKDYLGLIIEKYWSY
jgi:hypothetical protein